MATAPECGWPQKIREYRNHHIDSTLWNEFSPRDGDIIVDTCYKSGTTWMLQVINELLWQGREKPTLEHNVLSPWVDFRRNPPDTLQRIESMKSPRLVKTHLPLDGMPFFPQCKYVYVGRSGLDVFMSMWNMYSNYTGMTEAMNRIPGRQGLELPKPPEDVHQFFKDWTSKGWFDWECDGYPFWGYSHHAATWWPFRNLPNIMFLHYDDLKADLPGTMRKIAEYLGIPVQEDVWGETVRHCTFEYMREHSDEIFYQGVDDMYTDGSRTLIYKGTNDRWKTALTPEEIQQWHCHIRAVLPADCVEWLERNE